MSFKETWSSKITGILLVASALLLPISTTPTCILFPLATILSLFSGSWQVKRHVISKSPMAIFLIAWTLLYIIGSLYSDAPHQDIFRQLSRSGILLCATILIGFFSETQWQQYILNSFLVAMLFTLILSYVKYYYHPAFLFHTHFDKSSVFKDHIIQNFLMVITAFIFIYRFLKKFRFRWIYGFFALAAIFNAIFISQGRSGYFIFAALLLYMTTLHFGWRGFLGALILTILLAGLAYHFSEEFRYRILAIADNIEHYKHGDAKTSIGIRLQSMENAYLLYKKKPWIGYGTGSFRTAYATLPFPLIETTGIMQISYNSYLNTAVELGIVGFTCLLLNFATQWRYSFFLSDEYRYLIQILLISMIVGCFANPWLSDTTELHLYALFLAISFSKKMESLKTPTMTFPPILKKMRNKFSYHQDGQTLIDVSLAKKMALDR